MGNSKRVPCPYCGSNAKCVNGSAVYPHRKDLRSKQFWVCEPCDARVGCHKNGKTPLGRLANAELRAAKMRAHTAFDRLWRHGSLSRSEAYAWLAETLSIPRKDCHIGGFDVAACQRIVEACRSAIREAAEAERSE